MSKIIYKQLNEVAKYRNDRISIELLTENSYISTENMIQDRGGVTVATSIPENNTVSKFDKSDILLSNIRPYFKKIWHANIIGGCSNDVLVVKPKKNINPRFLYYVLSDSNFFNYATVTSKGTKMPRGSKQAIMKYLVPDFELPVQTRIADILSTYDKLIENNNRRIELLEKAAQELYKEWFVRFRFPNHENTKFVNGLPEGWSAFRLEDVAEIGRGSSPRPIADQKYFVDGKIPWIKIADATASKMFIFKTKEYVNDYGASFSRKLAPGSLILAASGTLGFPMFLAVEGCIHDGWLYFSDFRKVPANYVYYVLLDLRDMFNAVSYGAAIQNINTDIVRKSKIIVPERYLIDDFHTRISEYHKQIELIQRKTENLKKQRDLLLPRLMSGRLEV